MRYRLAHSRDIKKNRWNNVCPSCGQRKFSPYIDTMTNLPIAAKECGRCCREKSCAYHMTPSQWFKDNPPEKREWLPREQYMELMRQRKKEAKQASPNPLPKRGLADIAKPAPSLRERAGEEAKKYYKRMSTLCTQTRSNKNHLAQWLCTLFPENQVAEVLARYRTGSTRDGRIIYWQIDESGQVHAGKVMAYNPDGHRRKESLPQPPPEEGAGRHRGQPPVCWVHSMKIDGIRFDEMLAPQCLFGLHLIDTQSVVCLVESEKTALILSLLCPNKVWLATGGKQNFKEQMLWPLLGYEVEVYPDADALADWYARAVEINRTLDTHLHIPIWYYDLMNHDEARCAGLDLADVLLG